MLSAKLACFIAVAIAMSVCVVGLDNGLGRTPQMGWNSWNHFGCDINEIVIRLTADALVSSGLVSFGYNYVNIDDCWAESRDSKGFIIPEKSRFPSGIKALADYVHSKGLKFGIYSDAGYKTCAGRPGSLGYETQDATSYASWGVDYLKYDNCNTDGTSPKVRYPVMRNALNATGHPMFYSMCEWGVEDPATWAASVGNSWRTTGDISDSWNSMISNINQNDKWASYAGPGQWNDPDMLEVGNGGMSFGQYRAHFSLWCLAKAPLLIGCDMTKLSKETMQILGNPEAIAVNQDSLGIQGRKMASSGLSEVWAGPLADGSLAVVMLNRDIHPVNITVNWSDIGLKSSVTAVVRCLWGRKNIGAFTGSFSFEVDEQGCMFVKITPSGASVLRTMSGDGSLSSTRSSWATMIDMSKYPHAH